MKLKDYVKENKIQYNYELVVYSISLTFANNKILENGKYYYINVYHKNFAKRPFREFEKEVIEAKVENSTYTDPKTHETKDIKVHYVRVNKLSCRNRGNIVLIGEEKNLDKGGRARKNDLSRKMEDY